MSIRRTFRKGVTKLANVIKRKRVDVYTFRPAQSYVGMSTADVAKIPQVPLGFKFFYDLYYYNDVVKTVIRALTTEIFRNGISIEPKFRYKCKSCGATYDYQPDKCPECGQSIFVQPSKIEKEILEKWIKRANMNDESLLDVLKGTAVDECVVDNAYLLVTKKYGFNEKGEVINAEPVEILRGNPENIFLIMNRQGRFGMTDDNKFVMFCLQHRSEVKVLTEEDIKNGLDRCQKCGKKLYPAYFKAIARGLGQLTEMYYTKDEIKHFKYFTHGIGYGLPPLLSVWLKAMILWKMDYFTLMAYHLQRPPKGILILKGQRESIDKAWQAIVEQARLNPHMIYPLVVEGGEEMKRVAEWVDLTIKADDVQFIEYRNELRRSIGAVYGVMPIFQADIARGQGLANEGLQITVTNRVVEDYQSIYNGRVLDWLVKQLGIREWKLVLRPHEEKDLAAAIQRFSMRIQNARAMKELGFIVRMKETIDGIDFDFEEPPDKDEIATELAAYLRKQGIAISERDVMKLLLQLISGGKGATSPLSSVQSESGEGRIVGVVQGGNIVPISESQMEGEPEHQRPRMTEQRFEGEVPARRGKTTKKKVGRKKKRGRKKGSTKNGSNTKVHKETAT